MNKWLAGLAIGILAATFSFDAEAQRRLGGGFSFGKPSKNLQQRQAQPPQKPQQQAAPAGKPAAAGAAAATSPWRGALMGLAAGLGLAALASWLGFGEAFAMFLMVAVLALLAMVALRMLMRRAQPAQPAYQSASSSPATWHGAGGPSFNPMPREPEPSTTTRTTSASLGRPGSAMDELMRGGALLDEPWGIPADFDVDGFLKNARGYFGRLQDAWAGSNLDELSEFTTQEMFTALTHELRARGKVDRVEVVSLDARLLGIEHDAQEHLASVRFTGTMRVDGELEAFDEVWNLTKPVAGGSGWLLAGIQQLN